MLLFKIYIGYCFAFKIATKKYECWQNHIYSVEQAIENILKEMTIK